MRVASHRTEVLGRVMFTYQRIDHCVSCRVAKPNGRGISCAKDLGPVAALVTAYGRRRTIGDITAHDQVFAALLLTSTGAQRSVPTIRRPSTSGFRVRVSGGVPLLTWAFS